jgi:O-antigen biosynthesis protein WbqP
MDIVLSLFSIVVLSPLLVTAALAIYFEDRGPFIFSQRRVGENETTFSLLKFRSMPINTGDVPSSQAKVLKITRVGKFIRRTNIDELPQLINIFRGEMSIVGPRPALPSQVDLIRLRRQAGAFGCRPGLTGLAQVNSCDGMPDIEKAKLDGMYSSKITFFQDVQIILKTFSYLLKPPPTY